VEGYEGTEVIVGYQNRIVSLINVEQARLKVLRYLLLVRIRLDLIHFLDLLLLGTSLNLVALIPLFKLLNLLFVKLFLRFLSLLIIDSLLNILGTKTRRLNPTLIDIPTHIRRVLTGHRLTLLIIFGPLHFLVAFLIALR